MNIVLIGMPGCGKTTLGVILAKMLGMDFLDSDVFIQNNEKRKLQDIINTDGNERFLEIEKDNILKIDVDNTVIATGGSVVLKEEAENHLKQNGKFVFIDVPYRILKKRIFNLDSRGIAMENGQTIKDIYDLRLPYYKKYADLTIKSGSDTKNDTIKKAVTLIKEKILTKGETNE